MTSTLFGPSNKSTAVKETIPALKVCGTSVPLTETDTNAGSTFSVDKLISNRSPSISSTEVAGVIYSNVIGKQGAIYSTDKRSVILTHPLAIISIVLEPARTSKEAVNKLLSALNSLGIVVPFNLTSTASSLSIFSIVAIKL